MLSWIAKLARGSAPEQKPPPELKPAEQKPVASSVAMVLARRVGK